MAFFLQEILKIVHLYARHLTFSSCTLEQKFNTETGIKIYTKKKIRTDLAPPIELSKFLFLICGMRFPTCICLGDSLEKLWFPFLQQM